MFCVAAHWNACSLVSGGVGALKRIHGQALPTSESLYMLFFPTVMLFPAFLPGRHILLILSEVSDAIVFIRFPVSLPFEMNLLFLYL